MTSLISRDKSDWKTVLLRTLAHSCGKLPFRHAFEDKLEATVSIHLAVFTEPYLTYVLEGKKTVESRFGVTRQPPFERVLRGDILVLKRSSGPVCGLCRVARVWYYRLDARTWPEIERFSEALCMDGSEFWKKRRAASFATLMQIEDVHSLREFTIAKQDPRSWVIVKCPSMSNQHRINWPS